MPWGVGAVADKDDDEDKRVAEASQRCEITESVSEQSVALVSMSVALLINPASTKSRNALTRRDILSPISVVVTHDDGGDIFASVESPLRSSVVFEGGATALV